jgi:replicative DNA helicase
MIGAAIMDIGVVTACALDCDDFFVPRHREAWDVLTRLAVTAEPIELTDLSTKLKGSTAWLSDACGPSSAAGLWQRQADRMRACRKRRDFGAALSKGIESAWDDETPIETTAQYVRSVVADLGIGKPGSAVVLEKALGTTLAEVELRRSRDKMANRVPIGLPSLTDFVGGLGAGNLAVVAGRPGHGKTSLGLQIADHAAAQNYPAIVFSLEMSQGELCERLLVDRTSFPARAFATGDIRPNQWPEVIRAASRICSMPLWVDSTTTKVDEILAGLHRFHADLPPDGQPPIAVIDYLQLVMTRQEKGKNREREIAEVTRDLKLAAKELRMPIVVLAQLNRGVEHADRRPVPSDLRESGAIEQDADVIIFPWREMDRDAEGKPQATRSSGPAELIIGKNRHGQLGRVRCHWQAETMRFHEAFQENQGDIFE